jgi:hypothetical protein
MPTYDPKELLLPALLAMDVYHRGPVGGLTNILKDKETSIGGATPFDATENASIGFYARAYTLGNTIYISYRGTDDGSLVLTPGGNLSSFLPTVATGLLGVARPLTDLYYGYPASAGSLSSFPYLGLNQARNKVGLPDVNDFNNQVLQKG